MQARFISIPSPMLALIRIFCLAHCFVGMTGVVNVSGGCAPSGWSAGPDMPTTAVRSVGVYFPANGKFYAMGGRASDNAGSEFTHPFEYDPGTNSWTTKAATYPDNQVNNMACGVLSRCWNAIHLLRRRLGSYRDRTATDRVFRYNPVTDVISPVAAPWPGALGTILPGGFTVFNNKLYILGGFDTIPAGTGDQPIWEFTPSPTAWVQKTAVLPVPLGYIPTTTIGTLIYTGGGSDITAGALTDTTNSFIYDPVADTISTIASIPRATGETRALNFNGQMLVMGGGRTAPNPSNEVDIYDPGTNTWSIGTPFRITLRGATSPPTPMAQPAFGWQAATIADGLTPLASMEIFCAAGGTPTPTPTATATALLRRQQQQQQPQPRRPTATATPDGDTDTDAVRRKMYSDAAASSDASASPIAPVAASLCEAQAWDDCKRG